MKKVSRTIFIISTLLFIIFSASVTVFSDVAVKIVVVNPSDTQARDVPVKYNLPYGVKREDIRDTGGLGFEYDVQEGIYFIKGAVPLGPKESKVIKIVLADIWQIPKEKFEELDSLLNENVGVVEQPEKQEIVKMAADRLRNKLSTIQKQQQDLEGDIEARMQRYYSTLQDLQEIRDDIFSLELYAKSKKEQAEEKTVNLVIAAENPTDKTLQIPLKYYLPKDVMPENIIDFSGFSLKYDIEKGRPYLERKENFGPREAKKWVIKVKNVWEVPEIEVEGLIKEAENTNETFAGSKFESLTTALYEEIKEEGKNIIDSQEAAETVDEKIAISKDNSERLNKIKDNLIKMQSLAMKDSDKRHNVLRDIKVWEDLQLFSDVLMKKIFDEGKISLFKMILGVIIFVIVVTGFVIYLWSSRIQKEDKQEFVNVLEEAGGEGDSGDKDRDENG